MANVYSIHANEAVYYGSTRNDPEFRLTQHIRDLKGGYHKNQALQALYDDGAKLRLTVLAVGLSTKKAVEIEDLILKAERENPNCLNKLHTAVYVKSNKPTPCEWNGVKFSSKNQAYKQQSLPYSFTQFKEYVSRGFTSCEDVDRFRLEPRSQCQPVVWDGIEYESKKQAVESGLLPFITTNALNRCIDDGISSTSAYEAARAPKPKPNRVKHTVMFKWNDQECERISDAAKISKLSYPTVKKAIKAGCTSDEQWLKRREIVWRGVTYPSIADAARELDLPYHTIYQALKS